MAGIRVEWLRQRTLEWHEFRAKGGPGNPYPCAVGASEASIIMAEVKNPDRALMELFNRKLGLLPEKASNFVMQRGRDAEPFFLEWISRRMVMSFEPAVFYREDKPWLICSADGISTDGTMLAEFKLCKGENFLLIQDGRIPTEYRGQLQHLLAVTGCERVMLVAAPWVGGEPCGFIVTPNRMYIERLEARAEMFCRAVRDGVLDVNMFLTGEDIMPRGNEIPDFAPEKMPRPVEEPEPGEQLAIVEDATIEIPGLGETRRIVLADHWVAQRDEWVREALELQVKDKSTADHAGILINAMTTFRKRLEEAKKLAKSPYKTIMDSIEETVKGLLAPAIVAEVALNKKLAAYIDQVTMERRTAEIAAQKQIAAARVNGASAVEVAAKSAAMAIALPEPAKPVGVASKRVVSFEIVDEGQVERKYCSPDEAKLRAAVKLLEKVYGEEIPKGSIPGVRVFFETKIQKH